MRKPIQTQSTEVSIQSTTLRRTGGPKTAQGRANSSKNAVKHGAYSSVFTLREEFPEEARMIETRLITELKPVGALEEVLAARIIWGTWRLRRLAFAETGVFRHQIDELGGMHADGDPVPFGMAVIRDGKGSDALTRIHAFERLIEGSIYRAMQELEQRQERRRQQEFVELPTVSLVRSVKS